MSSTPPKSGYAPVNGLRMYYEIHGEERGDGWPLVLIHGALSGIGTSFGQILPGLAEHRQIIALEYQAHARTGDIDRPLTIANLADDTAKLLAHLGVAQADVLGYSVGGGVALQLAIDRPELVGRLVIMSVTYNLAGFHPGLMDGIENLKPEHLAGTPFQQEYAGLAPNPGDWPALIEKIKDLDRNMVEWSPEDVQSIQAPMLFVIGDSDIVRPEHAVEIFRLVGGGVNGDIEGMPRSRLAILPGTSHITVAYRGDWLRPMIEEFLDAPEPAA